MFIPSVYRVAYGSTTMALRGKAKRFPASSITLIWAVYWPAAIFANGTWKLNDATPGRFGVILV